MANEATHTFIRQHLCDDVRALALKSAPKDVDLRFALQQIEARQLLKTKVPSWAQNEQLVFPPHLSIEQCSSELTAKYKSSVISGKTLVDLTGGLGIDCYFLSQNFEHTTYVEQQPHLVELAQQNFSVLSAKIDVIGSACEDYLKQMPNCDAIFIDPARRDGAGRKMVSIADCTPNILDLYGIFLQKAQQVLIKLSPMLDISKIIAELNFVKEIHVVSVANECKEILVLLEQNFSEEPTIFAVELTSKQTPFKFKLSEEKELDIDYTSTIGRYLYEPNVALLKSGAFKSISKFWSLSKLHKNSHLYTSNKLINNFQGRAFEVKEYDKMGKNSLQGINKANITVRNFPLMVAELRKKFKVADGGDTYVFATTLSNESKILIICHKAAN